MTFVSVRIKAKYNHTKIICTNCSSGVEAERQKQFKGKCEASNAKVHLLRERGKTQAQEKDPMSTA
jgi:hypothetical protein